MEHANELIIATYRRMDKPFNIILNKEVNHKKYKIFRRMKSRKTSKKNFQEFYTHLYSFCI